MNEATLRYLVDKAEGWSVDDIGVVRGPSVSFSVIQILSQTYKDALAAQLLRQIVEIAVENKQPWLWTNLISQIRKQSLGTDITEFTLNACYQFYKGMEDE